MARLVVVSGAEKGREFKLDDSQTIGRLDRCDIKLEDTRLSRENSRVVREADAWWAEDLDSKNGTFVNGDRIDRIRLADNDELRIGETYFVFLADEEQIDDSRLGPTDVYVRESTIVPGRSGADSVKVGKTTDRVLAFSKHAQTPSHTMTSFQWLRQDLGQRHAGFKILIFLGILLIAGGLFWAIQLMIGS